jgi:stage II sporulation protein R
LCSVHNEDNEGTVREMNSKLLVWGYLVVLSLATIIHLYIPKNEAVAKDSVIIPADAIRLRILANSDSGKDQEIKRQVRDAVNAQITLWVQELTSKEKAKAVLQSKLPEIQGIAEEVVASKGSNQSVKVEFDKVQFPTKLYGEFLYPAGEYEAILITLGDGGGANWWCVLYPPLCFLDFSNGVAVSDGFDESQTAVAAEKEEPIKKVEIKVEKEKEEIEVEEAPPVKEKVKRQVETVKKEIEKKVESKKARVEMDSSKEDSEKVEKEADSEKEKPSKTVKTAPVYTEEDEEPTKVKFFVVEMWDTLF